MTSPNSNPAGPAPADLNPMKRTLIVGGAGFVGTNLARGIVAEGGSVTILDSLARSGVERNLAAMRRDLGESVSFVEGDIRDRAAIREALVGADEAYHLAAQVAVTTSLHDPIDDFEVNARGTINLLEEIRGLDRPVPLVFTSTNKVYGGLEDVPLRLNGERYEPEDATIRERGISEARPLDFHSPYGCSKGAADAYVVDYARTFGLPAVVFRMSCIYGPHQFGTEDQGWVAHFLIRALEGRPITLYGDGNQVRDILYVGDLVRALRLAQSKMDELSGRAFNIGGGPSNVVSLREIVRLIESRTGEKVGMTMEDWRPGDQRYYVSDTRAFEAATGWRAENSVEAGLGRLHDWLGSADESPVRQAAARS